MMTHGLVWCLAILCTLGGSVTALAEEAGKVSQEVAESFADLPRQVNLGDTVEVTDQNGEQIRGKVVAFSASEIQLRRDEQTLVFSEDSVRSIQTYGDSLKNGALIGGLVGAGLSGLFVAAALTTENTDIGAAGMVAGSAIYIGAGIGIGVAIDATRKERKVVYASPPQNRVDISFYPIVTTDRRGLAVRVRF